MYACILPPSQLHVVFFPSQGFPRHYNDAIMSAMASPITRISCVCSCVSSGADQRKHQSSASLAFVRGIHRWPVNSPHKGSVTWKMFPFDDVITANCSDDIFIVYIHTWAHFTNGLGAYDPNLAQFPDGITQKLSIRSDHNFARTCHDSSVHICDLTASQE